MGPEKYKQIAMGQGQGEHAIASLHQCAEKGEWLCLQNIHLVIHWVPILENELSCLQLHPDFRLWLTTEQHTKFSSNFLRKTLKITTESPPGIKKNLERIYENWTAQYIESGNLVRAQSLFSLAWFHAVIQERRNFLPQGWNKFYEFSTADLRSSADLITVTLFFYDLILVNVQRRGSKTMGCFAWTS